MEQTRREFLIALGAVGFCGFLGWPQLTLAAANAPTDKRLMVVILRGAMDGLGAVVPIGDSTYHDARGALAFEGNGLLKLDNTFSLNPALKPLHDLYNQKQLVVMHAVASPYRERSHFDAQDLLENGTIRPHGLSTGWLARTLDAMGGETEGLAVGPSVPLVLQGTKNVETWAPSKLDTVDEDFLRRVGHMYTHDAALLGALNKGKDIPETTTDAMKGGPRQFVEMMKVAVDFMNKPTGPRLATIDIGGWDTHVNQGLEKGRLAQALSILADGISAYRSGMGETWKDTAVLVITEFGRTVMANGTAGTDHGTATAAFLAGGSVKGGRMIGEWPGLAKNKLYEDRDLYPANDLRSLVKGVLLDHMKIAPDIVEKTIFPESANAQATTGLFV